MKLSQSTKLRVLLLHFIGKKTDKIINDIDSKIKLDDSEERKSEIWQEIVKKYIEEEIAERETNVGKFTRKELCSFIKDYLNQCVPESINKDVRKRILRDPDKLIDNLVKEFCLVIENAGPK